VEVNDALPLEAACPASCSRL